MLANSFATTLEPFVKGAETLQRLAGLQMFSDTLNSLGGIFSRVAVLGIDAIEAVASFTGRSLITAARLFFMASFDRTMASAT